jgi:hypothetical protein
LMSSFDREALWGQVAGKLDQPRAKRVYLWRITYAAAAAVAGLLLFLLLQPSVQQQEFVSAVRSTNKPVAHAADTIKAPVTATAVTAVSGTKVTIKQLPEQQAPIPVVKDTLALAAETTPPHKAVVPEPVVTTMPVMHLLDISNEDRRIIAAAVIPAEHKVKLIQLNKPGGSTEEQPVIALRRVFRSGKD